jgi:hypothetical protein
LALPSWRQRARGSRLVQHDPRMALTTAQAPSPWARSASPAQGARAPWSFEQERTWTPSRPGVRPGHAACRAGSMTGDALPPVAHRPEPGGERRALRGARPGAGPSREGVCTHASGAGGATTARPAPQSSSAVRSPGPSLTCVTRKSASTPTSPGRAERALRASTDLGGGRRAGGAPSAHRPPHRSHRGAEDRRVRGSQAAAGRRICACT